MSLRDAPAMSQCPHDNHDSAQCPVCASESFEFLSRWVPTQERRTKIRVEPSSGSRSAQRVVVGVGVLGGAAYFAESLAQACA